MRTCNWCLLSLLSVRRLFVRKVQANFWITATLLAVFSAPHVCAQNPNNPRQVALQRWYLQNTVATVSRCTGSYPYWINGRMAFDGAHVWVPCFYDNYGQPDIQAAEIQEFNASDGTLVRTVPISLPATTLFLSNLVFDGENIWVSLYVFQAASPLIKIQASTGTILNTFTLPNGAGQGMAFDGTYVWVSIFGTGNPSHGLSKVMAGTGSITTYQLTNCGPLDVAFDGSHIWVSCQDPYPAHTVQELNSNGVLVATVNVGLGPTYMAFDGTNMWVLNSNAPSVSRVNVTTLASAAFLWGGCTTQWVAFDGRYMWVSGRSSKANDCSTSGGSGINDSMWVTSKMETSTGTIVTSYPNIGAAMVFDGVNMWGVDNNGAIKKF